LENVTSPGRRRFNVVLHHSNGFGVVITNDRTLYNWNCNRNANEQARAVSDQNSNMPFEVNNRQRTFPYNFE
jgi:hypothetical protein